MKRVSSLTRLARCTAADITSEEAHEALGIPREATSQEAVLGDAYHILAERWQKGETVMLEEVVELAYKKGVEKDDLLWLWGTLAQESFERAPVMAVEEFIEDEALGLSGHPDLMRFWPERGLVIVDDWKTGRLVDDAEHNQQIRTYCVLAWQHFQRQQLVDIERVVGNLIYLRASSSTVEFDAESITAEHTAVGRLMGEIRRQEALPINERSYRTGEHCRYCTGRAICPAFRKDAQIAMMVAMDLEVDMSTVSITKKGKPNKVELARAKQVALVRKVADLLATEPDKAWNARHVAGALKDALDEAFKQHLHFYGAVECVDGDIIELKEGARTPNLTTDHVAEALAYADVDVEKRAVVLDRIAMRPKVPSMRMQKRRQR